MENKDTIKVGSGSRKEKFGVAVNVLWTLALCIGAAIGGWLVHAQFAPKEALCNTYGGMVAQQSSSGDLANCGLNSFLSQAATVVQWAGIVGLVCFGGMVIFAAIAAMTEAPATAPETSGLPNAALLVPPLPATEQDQVARVSGVTTSSVTAERSTGSIPRHRAAKTKARWLGQSFLLVALSVAILMWGHRSHGGVWVFVVAISFGMFCAGLVTLARGRR